MEPLLTLALLFHASVAAIDEIVVVDRERLVLRNRKSPPGDITTELVRCSED